jgi:hypothetical protein
MNSLPKSLPEMTHEGGATDEIRHRLLAVWSIGGQTQPGMEHSPTSATGTGWERTPWHATHRAAWEALREKLRPLASARAEGEIAGQAPIREEAPEAQAHPTSVTWDAPARTTGHHSCPPMQLQIGDRMTDSTGEWEIVGRPTFSSSAFRLNLAR